jgi:four helix bundle protein
VSISSNIAEGHTREHIKEHLHHPSRAQGPLAEVETQVEIATRQPYLLLSEFEDLVREIRSLGRQLYALRNALRRSQTNNDGSN